MTVRCENTQKNSIVSFGFLFWYRVRWWDQGHSIQLCKVKMVINS